MSKKPFVKCIECGAQIPKQHKQRQRCRNCYIRTIQGPGHPMWNGGRRVTVKGYVLIHKPTHPFSQFNGYVLEHRLKMEKKLGRYLNLNEKVHHRDGDPGNNSIDNLVLCQSQQEHLKHHDNMMEQARRFRWKGHIKPTCKECGKPTIAKGLCNLHYRRWRRRSHHTA